MRFINFDQAKETPEDGDIILELDGWNDWWHYKTMFNLSILEGNERTYLGNVKILSGLHDYDIDDSTTWATPLPEVFESLGPEYMTVGQDAELYINLHRRFGSLRSRRILKSLGDLSVDIQRFEEVRLEEGVLSSLLRNVTPYAVRRQYPRIITHGDLKASFDFSYFRESHNPIAPPLRLDFEVIGDSNPPTNVHVLIGRNGCGKTSTLVSLGELILGLPSGNALEGELSEDSGPVETANLVYIAFSAFDVPSLPLRDEPRRHRVPYAYLGLQQIGNDGVLTTQSPAHLAQKFAESAWLVANSKPGSWKAALNDLASDPIFSSAEIESLVSYVDSDLSHEEFIALATSLYGRLSSGHKIVLLTVTRLVETVSERTMVLIDEPEGHLHPPLLSAFTRALSNLMREQSGVAIIATHSPVVLQEVPRSCVWRMRRTGNYTVARRPVLETFGENVGTLTNSVFGLEVTESGFHRLVEIACESSSSYADVMGLFGGQLGFEARGIVQAWFASAEGSQ
jgi:hypothetical protein